MDDFSILDSLLREKKGKIIHQIWFGTIPNRKTAKKAYENMSIYRDSWTIKNPEWFRVEWSKIMCMKLIKNFYPNYLKMWKSYRHEIQRCDAIRYFILHRYGGWYVDMDYVCGKNLSEVCKLFPNSVYLVQSPNKSPFQDDDHVSNSLMYSTPEHPLWKKVMSELETNQSVPYYYTKHLEVMFTTGPGILNRIYSKYKYTYKVKSLPWKNFHPFGIMDGIKSINLPPHVYAAHIGKGSWEGKDTKFLIFLMRDWKILIMILLYSIIVAILIHVV